MRITSVKMADDTEYETPSKKIKLDEESLQASSQELSIGSANVSTSEQHEEINDSVATNSSTEEKGKTSTNEETEKAEEITDKVTNVSESPEKSGGDDAGVADPKPKDKESLKELGKASQPIDVDELAYDSDDSDSDLSVISELSGLSGEDSWKAAPGGAAEWVYESMEKGEDPREVLQQVLPDETPIPNVDDVTLWKIVLSIVSEPPPRTKLAFINTLSDVVNLIKSCKRIMVLTGAGVSVACGIPDFRSRNGIYARLAVDFPDLPDPQAMFDIRYFRKDQRPFFKFAKEIYPGQFEPSKSHKFVALLEQHGKLLRNYTQNIDTLEQVAGIKNVIQCHGSFATATCMMCSYKCSGDDIKAQINDQVIPKCPKCNPDSPLSVMKPDIVFFGESLPEQFHQQMTIDKDRCDLLIVIGSSLKVRPVALIPNSLPSHVPQILINKEPLRNLNFDVELLGDCEIIISELCHQLGEEWESLANKRNPLREIPVHELLTPPATPDDQLDNPPPWVSKPTLFGTKDKDMKTDSVKDKVKNKDVEKGESADKLTSSDKPSSSVETSGRKSPVKDKSESSCIDEKSTDKSTKSDDTITDKSDQVEKNGKDEDTGTDQDSRKESAEKEQSKIDGSKKPSANSSNASEASVSKDEEKGETSKEKEGESPKETDSEASKEKVEETSKEKIEETSKKKDEETSKEKVEETSKEKDGETSKEKVEETSKKKDEETSKEKVEETSKEKDGETSKEKVEETSKKKDGETSKEKDGEISKDKEAATSSSDCIDLSEDQNESKADKEIGKINGEKPGSVVAGSSTSLEALRKMWKPSRYSVAQRLAPYQFCFVPPNRYIFNEAEVYTVIDSDSGDDCLHNDELDTSGMLSDLESSSLNTDEENLLRSPESGGDMIDLVSDEEGDARAATHVTTDDVDLSKGDVDDNPIVLDLDSDPATSKEDLTEIIDDTAGSASVKMDTSESRDGILDKEKQSKTSSTDEKMDTSDDKDASLSSDSGQALEKDLDKASKKDNEVDDELVAAAGDNASSETDKVSSKTVDSTLPEQEGSGGETVDKSEDPESKSS